MVIYYCTHHHRGQVSTSTQGRMGQGVTPHPNYRKQAEQAPHPHTSEVRGEKNASNVWLIHETNTTLCHSCQFHKYPVLFSFFIVHVTIFVLIIMQKEDSIATISLQEFYMNSDCFVHQDYLLSLFDKRGSGNPHSKLI